MGFYRNNIPNQKIGYVSNPVEGLNEYPSPINIRDNQFSDCLDVVPYRENSIKFNYRNDPDLVKNGIIGFVNEAIADIIPSEAITDTGEYTTNAVIALANYARNVDVVYNGTTVTVALGSHGLSVGDYFYIYVPEGKGLFQVAAVPNADSFTYTSTTSSVMSYWDCVLYIGYIYKIDIYSDYYFGFNITSLGYPVTVSPFDTPEELVYSSCLFATEAHNYSVFSCSGVKKLFYLTDGSTTGSVSLPFYPHKLITHANRIFALDDKNKLWWSKAGSFINGSDWYGSGTTTSSVVEDSGYWTVEKERKLSEMAVIGNTLFLFGTTNIYAFTGYDYDTFALQIVVPDIGVSNGYAVKHLSQTGNAVYFISGNDVYEFDGSNSPVIISHSLEVNNALVNGILGSIDLEGSGVTHISSDEDRVYIYKSSYNSATTHDSIIYVFEIEKRTWWKYSGFNDDPTELGTTFNVLYIPKQNRDTTYGVVSDLSSKKLYAYRETGLTGNTVPFVITKAFSSLPTDKQTLSSVAIQLQAVENADLNIVVSLSTSAEEDDFETIKEYDHYIANGKIETLELFLPIRLVSRTSHYRIKVQISNATCYLYNIERRFRTTGRSR